MGGLPEGRIIVVMVLKYVSKVSSNKQNQVKGQCMTFEIKIFKKALWLPPFPLSSLGEDNCHTREHLSSPIDRSIGEQLRFLADSQRGTEASSPPLCGLAAPPTPVEPLDDNSPSQHSD